MDSLSLILDTLNGPEASPVLDIGCGNGLLARALGRRGITAVGVDPSPEAIAEARLRAPDAPSCVARAEALPFGSGRFAGAVFLNSLHHIPGMAEALTEAARVLRPGAPMVVVEPLTTGSFFRAFLAIEDETEVREAAQRALTDALEAGSLRLSRRVEYERRDPFSGLDQFLERAAAADRSRDEVIRERRAEIERAFLMEAEPVPEGGYVLTQPLRAHILAAP